MSLDLNLLRENGTIQELFDRGLISDKVVNYIDKSNVYNTLIFQGKSKTDSLNIAASRFHCSTKTITRAVKACRNISDKGIDIKINSPGGNIGDLRTIKNRFR